MGRTGILVSRHTLNIIVAVYGLLNLFFHPPINGITPLLSTVGSEEQQSRRGLANHTEQKEPRYKKRSTRQSSLRSLEPQMPRQYHRDASPSASSVKIDPAALRWKQHICRFIIVTAIVSVFMVILILIAGLIMLAEKLRAIASISTSISCSAR
ncbi:hypothetical protein DL93DRAFT_447291 [Clavulina sp. PMI_390]|nr:hypothetical protein DL93DRAFT_447291 [Clavulina sp. PMI_390]